LEQIRDRPIRTVFRGYLVVFFESASLLLVPDRLICGPCGARPGPRAGRRCPPRNPGMVSTAAAVSVGQQLAAADPEHAGPFAGLDELTGGRVDPVKAGPPCGNSRGSWASARARLMCISVSSESDPSCRGPTAEMTAPAPRRLSNLGSVGCVAGYAADTRGVAGST
jgi:hypothetical protein